MKVKKIRPLSLSDPIPIIIGIGKGSGGGCKYRLKRRVPWNSVKQIIHIPCTIRSRVGVGNCAATNGNYLVITYDSESGLVNPGEVGVGVCASC